MAQAETEEITSSLSSKVYSLPLGLAYRNYDHWLLSKGLRESITTDFIEIPVVSHWQSMTVQR